MAAAFLTAASTRSKAAHVPETHRHRGHWHSWSHKLPATDEVHTEVIKHKPASQVPSLQVTSAGRHMAISRSISIPTSSIPWGTHTAPGPLLVSYSSLMLTSKYTGLHTHPSCTSHFPVSLDVPAQTFCPPNTPAQLKVPSSLSGQPWCLLTKPLPLTHTWLEEMEQQLAPGTQTVIPACTWSWMWSWMWSQALQLPVLSPSLSSLTPVDGNTQCSCPSSWKLKTHTHSSRWHRGLIAPVASSTGTLTPGPTPVASTEPTDTHTGLTSDWHLVLAIHTEIEGDKKRFNKT